MFPVHRHAVGWHWRWLCPERRRQARQNSCQLPGWGEMEGGELGFIPSFWNVSGFGVCKGIQVCQGLLRIFSGKQFIGVLTVIEKAPSSFLGAAERNWNARSTYLMEELDKSKLGDLYHIILAHVVLSGTTTLFRITSFRDVSCPQVRERILNTQINCKYCKVSSNLVCWKYYMHECIILYYY